MLLRQENAIHDCHKEKQKFSNDSLKLQPISWNEFRILQSVMEKSLQCVYIGRPKNLRKLGTKVIRQQLVDMKSADFNGRISSYTIWISNDNINGSVADILKGCNPEASGDAGDIDGENIGLHQCRKEVLNVIMEFEHVFETWQSMVESHEMDKMVNRSKNEANRLMDLPTDSFEREIDSFDDKDLLGYNPSRKFFSQLTKLIW